jgi:hypothetical protein
MHPLRTRIIRLEKEIVQYRNCTGVMRLRFSINRLARSATRSEDRWQSRINQALRDWLSRN